MREDHEETEDKPKKSDGRAYEMCEDHTKSGRQTKEVRGEGLGDAWRPYRDCAVGALNSSMYL